MAKNKSDKYQGASKAAQATKTPQTSVSKSSHSLLSKPFIPYLIIFLLCCGLYGNTLNNTYASDDTAMITDNKFTLKGFGGIKDLMTHDAFVGAVGQDGEDLVSGGRYRPLSMVTFAIEVQLWGLKPAVSHGINVLLFALTCLVLYHVLLYMLPEQRGSPFYLSIAFVASILYAAHPIHTEVVANIKGRDEILCLLFSLMALYAGLRYIHTKNLLHLAWGALVYFFALLSKENAITFIAIIPLTYYFFTKTESKGYLITIAAYLFPVVLFLVMRTVYTKSSLGAESTEIFNNPFAYLPKTMGGTLQHYATVIMTFLLYIKLLIYPHPLTHDYYFNQIPIIGITDPLFILSLIINLGLLAYAFKTIKAKTLVSYAVFFYFISFSIVSNVFFSVGVLMSERLIFVSSIGFVMLLAHLIMRAKDKFNLSDSAVASILVFLLMLYSAKTISRNPNWKDNMTLFLTDAKTSPNSAKVQMTSAGLLIKFADANFDSLRASGKLKYYLDLLEMNENSSLLPNTELRKEILQLSAVRIKKSLEIYPTHAKSLLTLGQVQYQLDHNANEAISYFQKAIESNQGPYYDALFEIGRVQLDQNMPAAAKETFLKALTAEPQEYAGMVNLATAYTNLNMIDSALYWYQRCVDINTKYAQAYFNMGVIYGRKLNNLDKAVEYMSKAIDTNPNIADYYDNLGVAYGMQDKTDEVIRVSKECLNRFPNYLPALHNLAISYHKKNDDTNAKQYEAQIARLAGH